MGLEEMTGSPNLTIVPDPSTFRVLPWAPGIGWVICDEYFNTGIPFHFSPRQLLKKQLARLKQQKYGLTVGLEVEWYLLRIADDRLAPDNIGQIGIKGKPTRVTAVEPGYSYHSESNFDIMQPVLTALVRAFRGDRPAAALDRKRVGSGPGRMHLCSEGCADHRRQSDPVPQRDPADHAPHGLSRKLHGAAGDARASAPAAGICISRCAMRAGRRICSRLTAKTRHWAIRCRRLGMHYLAGLLAHAQAATPFTTPTINGYRRYKPNSLAPDRATWAYDHRGVMARVLGAPYDPATRIENRIGEPSANPYLYIAAQIVSGLDGIANNSEPGPQELNPVQFGVSAAAENAARCARGAGRLGAVPRAIRRDLHQLFYRLQTHRAGPVRQVEERAWRRVGSGRRAHRMGAE